MRLKPYVCSVMKLKAIIRNIKLSLNGEEQDYTQGSIPRAVLLLATPMILELILESVFALVDMFFVGKLGKNAVATVGLTESVITIVYSIAMGLSTAATAIVARRTGEKNPGEAAHAAAQAMLLAIFFTVFISAGGIIFAGKILNLMGAEPDVIQDGVIFTRIMFSSCLFIMLLFLINGIYRGAGNAAMAMKSLWVASIINIILCPIFIHFWGLPGAAIATLTGRCCGVIYQCYHLFRGKSYIRFQRSHFTLDNKIIKSLLNVGWPATMQFLIASGSWIVLARIVADTGGTAATAGYQIAVRNFVFFMLPAWGLSNAAATLVGQNLGAKQIDRAEQSVLVTAKFSAIFTGCVMLLFLFFSTPIIGFFMHDAEVISYGSLALKIIGSAYIFYGVGMVVTQALNGAGDTRTPTLINLFCFWLFQVPLAFFLAKGLDLNATGAFIAIPVAETILTLLAVYFFRRGKWKTINL